jgi:hypothetical protein
MISLPLERKSQGCFWTQRHRSSDVALYALQYKQNGQVIGFDVFIIRKEPEAQSPWGRGAVPAHERFPHSEEYGSRAWSFSKQSTAMKKFEELESSLKK